jgi:hypothetical protein
MFVKTLFAFLYYLPTTIVYSETKAFGKKSVAHKTFLEQMLLDQL